MTEEEKQQVFEEREKRWGKRQPLSKALAVRFVIRVLERLPNEWRKKHLTGVLFLVEDSAVRIDSSGGFIVGCHESLGNVITIYLPFVHNRSHLEDLMFHEIAHHLGLNEKEVRKLEGLEK